MTKTTLPRIPLLLLLLLTTLAAARAQHCTPNPDQPISTDRPQLTNASTVVPCGSFQLENGLQLSSTSSQGSADLPETAIRLGITDKTELRVGLPDYFTNNPGSPDISGAPGFSSGFNDLTLGFKQQLGPLKLGPIHKLDLSLITSVSLPTGARQLSSHGYDPTFQLPWSRPLSSNWTVAGMLSLAWPTESARRNLTGESSTYFDRQLSKSWDAWVEYAGYFPQRGAPQHNLVTGTAYKLTPHQQLDFHANFGFASATPDHAIGVGYSVRFQAFARY